MARQDWGQGLKGIVDRRIDIFIIDPRKLVVKEGWNSRAKTFDPEDSDDLELARSIAENGVKNPMTVNWEDQKAYITDGHRRHAATMYAIDHLGAEIVGVPVQTEGRGTSEADRILSQHTRNTGKRLEPVELGAVFAKLAALGWSEDMISKRAGVPKARVCELLDLQAADKEVVDLVRDRTISADLAIKTMKANRKDGTSVQTLKDTAKAHKAEGKTRVTAKHLPKPESVERAEPTPDPHAEFHGEDRIIRPVEEAKEEGYRDGIAAALSAITNSLGDVWGPEARDAQRALVGRLEKLLEDAQASSSRAQAES